MRKKKLTFNKIKQSIVEYIISNRLFICYVLISLIGTIMVRNYTIGSVSIQYPLITDLGLILLIGSFAYFVRSKKQYRFFSILLWIYCLIEVVNSIYYSFYTNFASFGDLASLSQAETVTGSIIEKIHLFYCFYLILPFLFNFVHQKLLASPYYNYIDKVEKGKKMFLWTAAAGLFFLAISFSFATKTDYSRLNKQWNRGYIVERFGILMYEGNDLFQTIRPKLSGLFGYEEAYNSFNEYYDSNSSKEYKSKNKYTGILKGKNVIFVHMESIQDFTMDLSFNGIEVTPNLNKLAEEGMFFSNFYPQVSTGTSSDTEFTLLSSLMPAASGPVFVSYYNRNYSTLPKILGNNNYYTFSMHGNYSSMWNRNKAHPSLGYQEMFFEESFEYTEDDIINLGINDCLFFKEAMPILETIEMENENYMGTVITLSNHSPFKFQDKYGEFDLSVKVKYTDEETGEFKEEDSNYLLDTSVGKYLTSVHYADKALGDFIKYIKKSDFFDNTVFVFYGDHDAKLSRKEMNYLYNYNPIIDKIYQDGDEEYMPYDSYSHELNKKTPLIIWTKNSSLKKVFKGEIDYYMGMMDVSPTLLNMFGLSNEYALGHDIFNIRDNNIVAYPNGNFLTNMLYYNNSTGEYKIINENTIIDEDYINERKASVEKLLEVSNSIIVYDLISAKEKENE